MKEMTLKQKLVYIGLMICMQSFQLGGVILIAILNNAFFEFIGMYIGFVLGKTIYGKSWHASTIVGCTLTTFIVFYLLTCGTLPLSISLYCCFMFGFGLTYILYKLAILKEMAMKTQETINKSKLDLNHITIEELRKLCTIKFIPEADTNFLVDFIINPKRLKKYQIATKYNYERSYIYTKARNLIKIIEDEG